MNILLGSHYFYPHIGGIESVVESHAKGLAERGHDIIVVSTDSGADTLFSRRDGYEVRRYKAWNPLEQFGIPYPIPNPIQARKRIREIFQEVEVDIVHVHGLNYLTTTVLLASIPSQIPIILHQHTPFVDYSFPYDLIEKINDGTIGWWNLQQSDLVLCIDPGIEQYVSKISTRPEMELMMNGVDTDYYHPRRAEQADAFTGDISTPVFFTISRMSMKKGIDTLLDSIKEINQRDVNVHFAIAGDGPMRNKVEQTAETIENVEILGSLSDETLAKCYASADVFLFTSKSGEAFPTLTMLEAFASGTPVIASELSDRHSGVIDGTNSILVEPGNSKELTQAIIKLATLEHKRSKMSVNARKSAEEYFSIDSRIDQLETYYHRLQTK